MKFKLLSKKLGFWKPCICHCEINSFLTLKDFSHEINDDIDKLNYLISYHELCQHLRDMHKPVNQIYLDDHYMILENHSEVKKKKKNSFKAQDQCNRW